MGESCLMCCAIAVLECSRPACPDHLLVARRPGSLERGIQRGVFLLPALGFLFLPWTTIMYVLFWTVGGLDFFGWLFVALAFVLDIGTYGGGAYGNRDRIPNYRT